MGKTSPKLTRCSLRLMSSAGSPVYGVLAWWSVSRMGQKHVRPSEGKSGRGGRPGKGEEIEVEGKDAE